MNFTAPTFIEGDVFKTIIPLFQQVSGQVGGQVIMKENDRTDEILRFCKMPRSRNEIQCFLKIKSRSYVKVIISLAYEQVQTRSRKEQREL